MPHTFAARLYEYFRKSKRGADDTPYSSCTTIDDIEYLMQFADEHCKELWQAYLIKLNTVKKELAQTRSHLLNLKVKLDAVDEIITETMFENDQAKLTSQIQSGDIVLSNKEPDYETRCG